MGALLFRPVICWNPFKHFFTFIHVIWQVVGAAWHDEWRQVVLVVVRMMHVSCFVSLWVEKHSADLLACDFYCLIA